MMIKELLLSEKIGFACILFAIGVGIAMTILACGAYQALSNSYVKYEVPNK